MVTEELMWEERDVRVLLGGFFGLSSVKKGKGTIFGSDSSGKLLIATARVWGGV